MIVQLGRLARAPERRMGVLRRREHLGRRVSSRAGRKARAQGGLGAGSPDQWAQSTQNIMHWATAMGWSAQFGVIAGSANRRSWTGGLVLGPLVWLAGYVVLPLAKIYKPIWDYDAETLAKDLSAHLVYGATTGAA